MAAGEQVGDVGWKQITAFRLLHCCSEEGGKGPSQGMQLIGQGNDSRENAARGTSPFVLNCT